ncbi:hypothetical protein G7B40_035320 [Aetokthonos hydrillicola Thurmond2011]|jgi:uncharacterized protein YegP (UPF0339 family)|uniref:Uncharacterized protein n=1 Tax=Aetokthonos hydrillicola Thurmond2011 TaxID=2712845 RepID=A0AAP5IE18_9CYAN|nr:hypothetical protein [Aetokthonos hydrillicola]MBO3460107.1 hypothetical protein [Aetokthonos hydrillicola CCALA 1050]MBW4590741.1 hypothetical protein [Aetokthonos hydrillicola CCALA 1050]MDR9899791.1 hypothetical protein [Aetokthonos hydrillicola Thurmond2011]
MLEYLSISKRQPEFPDYLNFQTLRDIGITHLQALSGKLWTDYNLHDPGVTILEVLCYAVTDLGYRNNLDIQDLLALDAKSEENNFFTPDEILTCNPVTDLDLRKLLIDIPGVRNARLGKLTTYEPAIYIDYASSTLKTTPPNHLSQENAPRLHPRGLYTVYIDLDDQEIKNACGQRAVASSDTLDQVKAVLRNYRNLCEDVHDIVILGDEEIGICCDIELTADADAEDVLVNIYTRLEVLISPPLRFYTLQELLDKGKSIAEIFAGRPAVTSDKFYTSHGFIDPDELEALTPPKIIYTSDLYQEILKVPGVATVKRLSITNFINGLAQSNHPWYLHLTEGYSPVLGIEHCHVTLFKSVLPIAIDVNEVKRRYHQQKTAYAKALRQDYELNLAVPQGSYYNLADHYSIQHDFPLTYGISEEGLPETASALRKAQARQLKGYLVFFDQLLANYFAQLAHVRDLFSWEVDQQNDYMTPQQDKWHTYFNQVLDFPDKPAILRNGQDYLNSIQEETEIYRDRRNRFLDHMLGRFAESFTDYVLFKYQIIQEDPDKIIHHKAQFLQDYPSLSRDRFRAFNYCNCNATSDTENVSGFQKRVSRLLGFQDVRRRNLCHYQVLNHASFTFSVSCGVEKPLTSYQTYTTQEEAQAALEKFLLLALHKDFYKIFSYKYDPTVVETVGPAVVLTIYGYGIVDTEGKVLAASTERFSTRQRRKTALRRWFSNIQVNHDQFKLTVEKSNTGYLFTLKDKTTEQIFLQSLKSYTSERDAWNAASKFAQHLRYLSRYVSLVQGGANQSYSLGITDQTGKVLAITPTQTNPFETFKRLNSLEPFLEIESVTETTSGYRFRLVDWQKVTLLQGTELLENENAARDRFYRNLLGILDSAAIFPTQTSDGFSFRVLSRPRDINTVVAIHPQNYATASERDAAINRLFLFVRTARLSTEITSLSPAYVGYLEKEKETELLKSQQPQPTEEKAWQYGNILLELAQRPDNFRLIDAHNGPYGWELTNDGKQPFFATQYYASKSERNQAISAIQSCINDEGFHVLEHILLLPPKNFSLSEEPPFLPIFVTEDDMTNQGEQQWRLTRQDPYSFWISIILPYWPERFRNMDFRGFVERTLRLEAPAHVALKITWLDLHQMAKFEVAYSNWLKELARNSCDLTRTLKDLLTILPDLQSVYPHGVLIDTHTSNPDNEPIILNQTVLGTSYD